MKLKCGLFLALILCMFSVHASLMPYTSSISGAIESTDALGQERKLVAEPLSGNYLGYDYYGNFYVDTYNLTNNGLSDLLPMFLSHHLIQI
ncbi:hypothetical protein HR060_10680 [Catenovulum sp. SM1970]|uniref:hypothetical protein n=1 Tax=Marinifaba aquimaris TaxID=2741323 RepID=UPI0015722393|nr:hypothetical protein [Marinifaba aquimaris]NTS77329.1 hypothetical protein [Marinifaba aquimaris]